MKVVNSKRLEALVPLLQQFVNSDEQLELQVVYAIQKLIVRMQHPQGMVVSIFSCFYDADLISEESFNKWKTSDDPMEQGGKGKKRKPNILCHLLISEIYSRCGC